MQQEILNRLQLVKANPSPSNVRHEHFRNSQTFPSCLLQDPENWCRSGRVGHRGWRQGSPKDDKSGLIGYGLEVVTVRTRRLAGPNVREEASATLWEIVALSHGRRPGCRMLTSHEAAQREMKGHGHRQKSAV
jgi:hypothetical protein